MDGSSREIGDRVPEELAQLMIAVMEGVELGIDTLKMLSKHQLICYIRDQSLLFAPKTLEQLAGILEQDAEMSFFTVKRDPYTRIVNFLSEGPKEEELNRGIEDLNLGNRTRNALARSGYRTIRQLVESDVRSIREVRNFGEICRQEVERALKLGRFIPENANWPRLPNQKRSNR